MSLMMSHDTLVKPLSPCQRQKWIVEGDQSGIEIILMFYTHSDVSISNHKAKC